VQKKIDVTALERYSTFDPHIGFSKTKSDLAGYDIWPEGRGVTSGNRLKIMATGGSTSTWPGGEWGKDLGKILESKGHDVIIFNGGMGGYSTSQELLKVLRDAPALKPEVVVSLSGVNDMGFLHNVPRHPLLHRYQHLTARYLKDNLSAFQNWVAGVPEQVEASDVWIRNIRLMHAISAVYGAKFFSFLQPTMVYGDYKVAASEEELLKPQAYRTLETGRSYIDEVTHFYDGARDRLKQNKDELHYVHDLSYVFAGKSNLYRDYRHQNEQGDLLIAEKIADALQTAGVFK